MIQDAETLSERDFAVIAGYVEREIGIRLPAYKREMVQVRAARRVRDLGFRDFGEYVAFAFGGQDGGVERARLVDAITTNKTDFFRETRHFAYVTETALPQLLAEDTDLGRTHPLVAWCAACSTGEEPYSLSMILKSQMPSGGPSFLVHATDICSDALAKARSAVYAEERASTIPSDLRSSYLLQSRDRSRGLVRVSSDLRSHVRFERANLLSDPVPVTRAAHIVFCRNVLIYFNRETQERVLRRIIGAMRPGGYLFVGHSEGLLGFDLPVERVATSVYRVCR